MVLIVPVVWSGVIVWESLRVASTDSVGSFPALLLGSLMLLIFAINTCCSCRRPAASRMSLFIPLRLIPNGRARRQSNVFGPIA